MGADVARGGRLVLLSVLTILAFASRGQTSGLKDHVVTLNDTAAGGEENARDVETNEVYLWNEDTESTYHPHREQGKPSKFDVDVDQLTITDDETAYQIESSKLDNPQANTIEASACQKGVLMACIQQDLGEFLDRLATLDVYNVSESVQIVRAGNVSESNDARANDHREESGLMEKVEQYAKEHVLKIKLDKDLVPSRKARTFFGAVFQGKSTFLTGFGLGFLAFGLKKLLLPLFIGAQIIKTALIALFLPSIIGSLGKLVGKGLASFAQSSQSATAQQPEENFEFKDNNDFYSDDYLTRQPVGTLPASAMYDESMLQHSMTQKAPEIASRYSFVDPKITHANALSDRYYTRHVASHGLTKTQDFKVFHEIPTSSLLLTNYDPFYSPLLSRLDAVFSRLGHTSEGCREYTVCAMYRSPARYAPYSNLVSAQLSRELNELRKPSSDNPDVLRFFRYMKAAKDGQDGLRCEDVYGNCATARDDQMLRQNQAMLATYQDIDKLVHARKL